MFRIVTFPGSEWCLAPFEGQVFSSVQEAEAALVDKGYEYVVEEGEKVWEHPRHHDFQWAEILPADPPPRQLYLVSRKAAPWYGGYEPIGLAWATSQEAALQVLGITSQGLEVRCIPLNDPGMDVIIF